MPWGYIKKERIRHNFCHQELKIHWHLSQNMRQQTNSNIEVFIKSKFFQKMIINNLSHIKCYTELLISCRFCALCALQQWLNSLSHNWWVEWPQMDILTWILSCGWYHVAAGAGLVVKDGALPWLAIEWPWPDGLPMVSPHHMDFSQNDSFFELVFQQTETTGSCQSLKAWTDTASFLCSMREHPDSRKGDKHSPSPHWEKCKRICGHF